MDGKKPTLNDVANRLLAYGESEGESAFNAYAATVRAAMDELKNVAWIAEHGDGRLSDANLPSRLKKLIGESKGKVQE